MRKVGADIDMSINFTVRKQLFHMHVHWLLEDV